MQVQELVGIVPWTFIAQICNLFIQMYLIKRFLFKPINEMLEKRRAAADAEITDAEAAKKEANAIKEEYEQNMQEAKAKANEIPLKYWNPLQKGESIEAGGKVYTPDMVLGPARKGLKVTYCTDSRPTVSMEEHAKESDLLICEGMYGEPEKDAKAREYKHMTMKEAAKLAKKAQVKEMWLTHFSPSLVHPEEYMDGVREIFPNSYVGKDGKSVDLLFEEEENE